MSNLIKSKGTKLLNKQFYKTTYINIIHDDYISSIGQYCFANSNIKKINLINCKLIEDYAFYSCKDLEEITIANDAIIKDFAFYNCVKLQTINRANVIKDIGNSAFENCFQLKLKNKPFLWAEYIGNNCFKNCYNLIEQYLQLDNCKYIGNNAFENCKNFKQLIAPNIMYIGSDAFKGTFLENYIKNNIMESK